MIRLIPYITLGFLVSCAGSYEPCSREEIIEIVSGNKGAGSTMWRGTFYTGSDEESDYFVHTYKIGRDLFLKVPIDEIPLPKRFELSDPKKDWEDVSIFILELSGYERWWKGNRPGGES